MPIKVKNLNGTSDNRVPFSYSSWLDYWEKKAQRRAGKCGHCDSKAIVGAHVQKAGNLDRSWYIVPLCYKCNCKSSSEEFVVDEELVPVNNERR